jgi:dihydrofolate reductase
MRKIVLYIAASLDGKIARKDGDVKWLDEFSDPEQMDYGYNDFLNSIDTTLMGNNTYKQLLGFGIDFPYRGKTNYVFTRNARLS